MKVLITGINGFLGSHLAKMALVEGHSVLGISRDDTNIKELLNHIVMVKQQTPDYGSLKDAVHQFSPDVVIHLAWSGGNSYSDVNSLKQFSVNLPMLASLLNLFDDVSSKPMFVGLGSFSEYGNLTIKATEDQTEAPQNYYGLAKLHAKTMSEMFCKNNDMGWRWIRPCYVYGEGDVSTRLIPRVIRSLLLDKEVFLDDCFTTIDYIHIEDFTKGVISLLKDNSTNGVFNICSGREYILKDLIQTISKKIVGDRKLVRFDSQPERKDFPKHISGSIEKITKTTGWNPKIDIDLGLRRTIEYISNTLPIEISVSV